MREKDFTLNFRDWENLPIQVLKILLGLYFIQFWTFSFKFEIILYFHIKRALVMLLIVAMSSKWLKDTKQF